MPFFIFSHQYQFTSAIVLLGDQWSSAHTAVSNGNFIVPARPGWLFGPTHSSYFLSSQQSHFQSCFSFSEASCWASVASFSKFSLQGIFLRTMTGLPAVGSFEGSTPCCRCQQVISLRFRTVEFGVQQVKCSSQ